MLRMCFTPAEYYLTLSQPLLLVPMAHRRHPDSGLIAVMAARDSKLALLKNLEKV